MEFKIDTKDTFTVITPVAKELNAQLADNIAAKCEEIRQNGSSNFIIDLQNATTADQHGLDALVKLHEDCYGNDRSLVFTGATAEVMRVMKENETDLLLNVAPKMIEAVDIISMEILERDLLGEE
jgi:anti-anti-sigma factor